MKKFKLKEAIKNEIKSVLSEDSLNEISSTEANAQLMEIVEYQNQILNILKELKKGADLDAAIRIIENEVGKTLTKIKNLKQIKGLQTTFAGVREDRKAKEYIQSIEDPEEREAERKRMFDNLDEDSFEGMTPEDIKLYQDVQRLKHTGRTLDDEREAAERKKKNKEEEYIDYGSIKKLRGWDLKEAEESDLDKVKAEIKKHLAMYQDAEGDMAKKSAVEMLKKLNVEKKRLEAEEIEKASSIGMGQELDYDSED